MKRISILGAGESGVGAAILAKKLGYDVFVSDYGTIDDRFSSELNEYKIDFESGKHSASIFDADICIKSPGIPDTAKPVLTFIENGIPVYSEIEFASKYTESFIVGVTGSNGKTTTASLIYHMLNKADKNVALVGNIGVSLARQIALDPKDIYVVELSSFQLDNIDTFKPNISIILNISPDHLDRYCYDINKYALAKWNITKNQAKGDILIVNENLEGHLININKEIKNIKVIQDGQTKMSYNEEEIDLNIGLLKGQHNIFNMHVAVKVMECFDLSKEEVEMGLMTFKAIEHRMEIVNVIDGVKYINDSKATNLDAVRFALDAMTDPVIWIVGGVDKGNDYSEIDSLVKNKVKSIVLLGVDNSKLLSYYESFEVELTEVRSADEAVKTAQSKASPGDTVLLSPACASFDLFKNYVERGDLFKKAVLSLNL